MNQVVQLYQPPQQLGLILDDKKIDLLKATICKGSSDEEFELFLHACKRTGLDPFMRQIYAVKRWDNNVKRETMTIQTGIDGYRLIAERSGKYSPGREPIYQYTGDGKIISSTAFVKKQTADGTWHEVAATAFFDEYCQKTKEGKPTRFWMQMGHTMLAKCAEALALRKAFPGDLSGLYTKEEMQQAEHEVISEPTQKVNVDHIGDVNNMVQAISKTISKDQAIELNKFLEQCDEPFKEKVWNYLKSQNINNYEDMSEETFNKMKNACIGQIQKKARLANEAS